MPRATPSKGKPKKAPTRSAARETKAFVAGLKTAGRLQEESGPLKPGATHVVEAGADGEPVISRRRFSAI